MPPEPSNPVKFWQQRRAEEKRKEQKKLDDSMKPESVIPRYSLYGAVPGIAYDLNHWPCTEKIRFMSGRGALVGAAVGALTCFAYGAVTKYEQHQTDNKSSKVKPD